MSIATPTAQERAASRPTGWVGNLLRSILVYALLAVVGLITAGPFLMMLSASLRPNLIYLSFPMPLIPPDAGLANYAALFDQSLIGRWILNSTFITVSATFLRMLTCSMAGFAFARGRFPLRDSIFWLF